MLTKLRPYKGGLRRNGGGLRTPGGGLLDALTDQVNLLFNADFSAPVTSWTTGRTGFSSTYATDEWDISQQTYSGGYSNSASGGTETLTNTGGYTDQTAPDAFDGTAYGNANAWESDATVANDTYLTSSGTTAGDSDNEAIAWRVVYRCTGDRGNSNYLISKYSGSVGWYVAFTTAGIKFGVHRGSIVENSLTDGGTDDGALHVAEGWYDPATDTSYIRTDKVAESSADTSAITLSLTNSTNLYINKYSGAAGFGQAGLQVLYAGVAVGSTAEDFYNDAVFQHATDPTGLLTTTTRASLISREVAAGYVAHFADDTLPIGYNSAFNIVSNPNQFGLRTNSATTNLLPQSESTTGWNNTWAITTSNYGDAPDGFRKSIRLQASAASQAFYDTNIAVSASTDYTWGAWVRSTDGGADTDFRMTLRDEANATNVADVTKTATADWQFFWVTGTMGVGATTASNRIISLAATDDIEVIFFQMNQGTEPASYARTKGSTATVAFSDYAATGSAGEYCKGATGEIEAVYVINVSSDDTNEHMYAVSQGTGLQNCRTAKFNAAQALSCQYFDSSGSVVDTLNETGLTLDSEITHIQRWDSGGNLNVGGSASMELVEGGLSEDTGTAAWTGTDTATVVAIGQRNFSKGSAYSPNADIQSVKIWDGEGGAA